MKRELTGEPFRPCAVDDELTGFLSVASIVFSSVTGTQGQEPHIIWCIVNNNALSIRSDETGYFLCIKVDSCIHHRCESC